MLLFGYPNFFDNINSGIIYTVIKFIESTNLFSESIMINITPNIFYFRFIFSAYFIF